MYKKRACNKKLEFDVLMCDAKCKYCNFKGDIGIDRIDNSIGYISNNIVSCCKVCNVMKNKYSVDNFLNKCIAINTSTIILEMCKNTVVYNGLQTSNKNNKDHTRNCLNCDRCIIMNFGFCSKEHSNLFFSQRTK